MDRRTLMQIAALGQSFEAATISADGLRVALGDYVPPEPRLSVHEPKKYRAHARKGKAFDGTRAKVKAARKQNRKRK